MQFKVVPRFPPGWLLKEHEAIRSSHRVPIRLTEAPDHDFVRGYCFTGEPSSPNRQQQVVIERLRFYRHRLGV
jgi:hypothetical protein